MFLGFNFWLKFLADYYASKLLWKSWLLGLLSVLIYAFLQLHVPQTLSLSLYLLPISPYYGFIMFKLSTEVEYLLYMHLCFVFICACLLIYYEKDVIIGFERW